MDSVAVEAVTVYPNKSVLQRMVFFFKQKTAYEIGTGDWSSDVCSSDLCDFGDNRRKSLGRNNMMDDNIDCFTGLNSLK